MLHQGLNDNLDTLPPEAVPCCGKRMRPNIRTVSEPGVPSPGNRRSGRSSSYPMHDRPGVHVNRLAVAGAITPEAFDSYCAKYGFILFLSWTTGMSDGRKPLHLQQFQHVDLLCVAGGSVRSGESVPAAVHGPVVEFHGSAVTLELCMEQDLSIGVVHPEDCSGI